MKLRKALYKIYWKIERLITPTLKYSQFFYEELLRSYVKCGVAWADVGCGHQILPPWRLEQEKRLIENCSLLVGIDAEFSALREHKTIPYRIVGDISNLPLPDEFFDLATANMVVEHLDHPEIQFREINRLLKPGGIFIFHTPNRAGYPAVASRLIPDFLKKMIIWLLEGRRQADVFKTFYRANSPKKIRNLSETTGFAIVKIKLLVSSAELAIFFPIVPLELLWIRLLMTKPLKPLRTNIIAILRKKAPEGRRPKESRNVT